MVEDKQEEPKVEEKQEEKKEEKQEEEKNEEKKKEEEKPSPSAPTVLYVDLHCVGCAKKIERSILRCRGVESVEIDMGQNQVTLKGIVDTEMICSRIRKKTMRDIKVLSPEPNAVTSLQMSTEELHVNMHCEACAQQLRKKILKMRGVQKVETELSSGKVTVTGTMNADRLVEYVYRRTRKQARIVPQPTKGEEKKEEGATKAEEKPVEEDLEKKEEKKEVEENKDEEKKDSEKKEEEGEAAPVGTVEDELNKKMMHWPPPIYVIEQSPDIFLENPLPQLFSDENPNACSIS